MKYITKQLLLKSMQGKPLDIFATPRPTQPFPGKYPTRVYLRAKDFEYFGKPSVTVCRGLQSAREKCHYPFLAIEFDKGGPIYAEAQKGKDYPRSQTINMQCWQEYHPQSYADSTLSWMLYSIRIVESRYALGDANNLKIAE